VLCKSQKIEKYLVRTQYFGPYEVPNGAYFNVESVYLEKLRKLNLSQEFDYAHHPNPGFSNCFFTWVCGNASIATTKNARGTFFVH
jgi:hypothetical protein